MNSINFLNKMTFDLFKIKLDEYSKNILWKNSIDN